MRKNQGILMLILLIGNLVSCSSDEWIVDSKLPKEYVKVTNKIFVSGSTIELFSIENNELIGVVKVKVPRAIISFLWDKSTEKVVAVEVGVHSEYVEFTGFKDVETFTLSNVELLRTKYCIEVNGNFSYNTDLYGFLKLDLEIESQKR
jgi:hypothetical protein